MIIYGLRIKGKVQGVFYRYWLCNRAQALDIGGWVANDADDSVVAHLCGEKEEALKQLIEECKEGPELAVVDTVEVENLSEEMESPYPFKIK